MAKLTAAEKIEKLQEKIEKAKRVAKEAKKGIRRVSSTDKAKERKFTDRQKYVLGGGLMMKIAAGDQRAIDLRQEIINGLTRNDHREAFGLALLPKTEVNPKPDPLPESKPKSEPVDDAIAKNERAVRLSAADARVNRVCDAWKLAKSPSESQRIELIRAIVAWEKLADMISPSMPLGDVRTSWGFLDRPGEVEEGILPGSAA